jgi:hypothetical protein
MINELKAQLRDLDMLLDEIDDPALKAKVQGFRDEVEVELKAQTKKECINHQKCRKCRES